MSKEYILLNDGYGKIINTEDKNSLDESVPKIFEIKKHSLLRLIDPFNIKKEYLRNNQYESADFINFNKLVERISNHKTNKLIIENGSIGITYFLSELQKIKRSKIDSSLILFQTIESLLNSKNQESISALNYYISSFDDTSVNFERQTKHTLNQLLNKLDNKIKNKKINTNYTFKPKLFYSSNFEEGVLNIHYLNDREEIDPNHQDYKMTFEYNNKPIFSTIKNIQSGSFTLFRHIFNSCDRVICSFPKKSYLIKNQIKLATNFTNNTNLKEKDLEFLNKNTFLDKNMIDCGSIIIRDFSKDNDKTYELELSLNTYNDKIKCGGYKTNYFSDNLYEMVKSVYAFREIFQSENIETNIIFENRSNYKGMDNTLKDILKNYKPSKIIRDRNIISDDFSDIVVSFYDFINGKKSHLIKFNKKNNSIIHQLVDNQDLDDYYIGKMHEIYYEFN